MGLLVKFWSLTRWNLEPLENERSKVSPLGPPRMVKSTRSFWRGNLKEGDSEEWGRDQPLILLTQHWFWYPWEQIEGINGTSETLGWHYKRRGNQWWRAFFSNSRIRVKNPKESFVRIQKGENKGQTPSEILKQPLENTLGFKGIQTSQILEVWRAI